MGEGERDTVVEELARGEGERETVDALMIY